MPGHSEIHRPQVERTPYYLRATKATQFIPRSTLMQSYITTVKFTFKVGAMHTCFQDPVSSLQQTPHQPQHIKQACTVYNAKKSAEQHWDPQNFCLWEYGRFYVSGTLERFYKNLFKVWIWTVVCFG